MSKQSKNKQRSTSTSQTNTQTDPMQQATDALQKGAQALTQTTERVLDVLQNLSDKFVSTSKPTSIRDAIGREAEVSVAVPPSGAGEVILSISGSLRHYPARGRDARKSFRRGMKVNIGDCGSDTVFVEELH
jgi:hypothetical protein